MVIYIRTPETLVSGQTNLTKCSSNNSTSAKKSFPNNIATRLTVSTTTKTTMRILKARNRLPAGSSSASPTPSSRLPTVLPEALMFFQAQKPLTCVITIQTITQGIWKPKKVRVKITCI